MQLVAMAAVLAAGMVMLRRVESSCIPGCALQNMLITVEGCGHLRTISTTVCAGQCYMEAPVFLTRSEAPSQQVCSGQWTYRTVGVNSAECQSGFTFPEATACTCTTCDVSTAYCDDRLATEAVQEDCTLTTA